MLYFAYGSNMDPRQIRRRCPSSRFEGVALLPDHELAFTLRSRRRRCGVANVIPKMDNSVLGVLYRINRTHDWKVLDLAEGFRSDRKRANRYTKSICSVQKLQGYPTEVSAFIYIGIIEKSPPPPSRAYLNQMIAGVDQWRFPESYKQSLERIIGNQI